MATQTCKQVSKQSFQVCGRVVSPKLPTELVACHRLSLTKVAEDSLSAIGKELMRRTREAICKQFGEDYK